MDDELSGLDALPVVSALLTDTVPLDSLRRTREALEDALAYAARADLAYLTVLRDLSDECRRRGGPTEPDSLSRLVFRWRQLQTAREAQVAQVRRSPVERNE